MVEQEFSHSFASSAAEFEEFKKKMADPIVVGAMLHKLSEERESANLLLKEINAKMDKLMALEERLKILEKGQPQGEVLLPEIDEGIVSFLKKRGKACAEDVQAKFGYKGRNAASSRLNRLCDLGVVEKTQVGKKVFFIPKSR